MEDDIVVNTPLVDPMVDPIVAPLPKVKKPMNPAEVERNERRKAAWAELKALNPKAKWTDASKLVSFRNKGNKASENAFIEAILNPAEAAAEAVVNNRPVTPAVLEATNGVERKFTRNNAKRSLERVMTKYDLKPSGSLIQKMLGLHRRGENNGPFLRELEQKTAAAANKKARKTLKKPKNATKVLTQSAWKEIKAQVNKNVLASGIKVNGINRRALATARKLRPNLSVANFMFERTPRIRRTKKNKVNFRRNVPRVPTKKMLNRKVVFNQAKYNATTSGLRLKAGDLQAFTTARMKNPGLPVGNFMRRRMPGENLRAINESIFD
jgi:hypothetical protein